MWFKQAQIFQLTDSLRSSIDDIILKLKPLVFKPCFPSMPSSIGWVSPIDEDDAPLARMINGCIMLCLQIEEKILPASVIRQELYEKIKAIEAIEGRKIGQKEKMAMKDEIVLTLLPRAFSKLTRVFAYIDTRNQWLVLGTTNKSKTDQFLTLFKKSITDKIYLFKFKKLSSTFTHWLKHHSYPTSFSIDQSCTFQDPNQQNRVIRCQNQDLFANSIQAIIKEGCEVKQLALTWNDQIDFILIDNLSLQRIRYQDDVLTEANSMESETKQQQFDADFLIMSGVLSNLLKELLSLFINHLTQESETPSDAILSTIS